MNEKNETAAGAGAPTAAVTQMGIATASDSNPFRKAVKYNAKGLVALVGPSGGGKSFTGLTMARALVGPNGKIAAIDTENGALSKYADMFDFDVIELDSFSPNNFIAALENAGRYGYDALLVDSFSHFWMGTDGTFDFVDQAQRGKKDGQAGWKEYRPIERKMLTVMQKAQVHVICTMRTKNDYQEQINDQGRKVRVKIGLAPVQREGLEYEFDFVGYMDEDCNMSTDKTRCSYYHRKTIPTPAAKDFVPLAEWLRGRVREPQPRALAIETGGFPMGTAEAAQHVAEQKIAELKTSGDIIRAFAAMREELGDFDYLGVLAEFGVTTPEKFRKQEDARECFKRLLAKKKQMLATQKAVA